MQCDQLLQGSVTFPSLPSWGTPSNCKEKQMLPPLSHAFVSCFATVRRKANISEMVCIVALSPLLTLVWISRCFPHGHLRNLSLSELQFLCAAHSYVRIQRLSYATHMEVQMKCKRRNESEWRLASPPPSGLSG